MITVTYDFAHIATLPLLFGVGIAGGVALRLIPWAIGRVVDSALLITEIDVTGHND